MFWMGWVTSKKPKVMEMRRGQEMEVAGEGVGDDGDGEHGEAGVDGEGGDVA